MNGTHFVEQRGNERILSYVSRYCAECYRELRDGETLYYDLEHYRYLCRECAGRLAEMLEGYKEEAELREGETLF